MPAPSVASVGTLNSGTGANRTPGIPSGITAAGFFRIILAGINANGATSNPLLTALIKTASANLPNIEIWYGFSPAAEGPGNYAINVESGLSNADVQAFRVSNVPTAVPFFGTVDNQRGVNTAAPVATSLAGVPAHSTLVWFCYTTANRTTPVPAGFTRKSSNTQIRHHWAVLEDWVGGDTGAITAGNFVEATATHRVVLFAILPTVDVTVAPPMATASGIALAPSVAASALLAPPMAVASAEASALTSVSAGATVQAPPAASATLEAVPPGVSASASPQPPMAVAQGDAFAPSVSADATPDPAPLAAASLEAVPPDVSADAEVEVAPGYASAEVAPLNPGVSAGSSMSPPLAIALAEPFAPAVLADVSVGAALPAIATTDAIPPGVSASVALDSPHLAVAEAYSFNPGIETGVRLQLELAVASALGIPPLYAGPLLVIPRDVKASIGENTASADLDDQDTTTAEIEPNTAEAKIA